MIIFDSNGEYYLFRTHVDSHTANVRELAEYTWTEQWRECGIPFISHAHGTNSDTQLKTFNRL